MTKVLALGLAAAIAGVVAAQLGFGGKAHSPATAPPARHFRAGPVHGLMLLPLADPDGRKPTVDRH